MIKKIRCVDEKLDIALFVSGTQTKRNKLYCQRDFELCQDMKKGLFSVYDEHERKDSKDIEEGYGLTLSQLFLETGASDVEEIHLKAIDGYESVVAELGSPRYYFPGLREGNESGRQLQEILLSFFKNGERVKAYPHPTIMFGQQGINDKNKDYFSKGLCSVVVGSRDRAFWVKGSAVSCNRYFGLDQLFELGEANGYEAQLLEVTTEDEQVRVIPGIKVPDSFWSEEIQIKDADAEMYLVSGENQYPAKRDGLYLFLSDEAQKQTGAWDGEHVLERIDGILIGKMVKQKNTGVLRIPQTKCEESDFTITIIDEKDEGKQYCYSINELKNAYNDLLKELTIEYYNHNMDHGKGGIRRVSAHGWLLTDLLVGLPEISGIEMIEEGGLFFKVLTNDSYKEKMAVEGSELTAFSYMLAYEHDQRTQTGMEHGDTSSWQDGQKHFGTWKGTTPYRVYCDKTSASPAVYKNVCGLEIKIR